MQSNSNQYPWTTPHHLLLHTIWLFCISWWDCIRWMFKEAYLDYTALVMIIRPPIWQRNISMLRKLLRVVLLTLQSAVYHWSHDVQSAHQVTQDSPLCHSRELVEITHSDIITTGSSVQSPCVWDSVLPESDNRANAWRCSFNTQNSWVITAWFSAVMFRPVRPTSGVVTKIEEFGDSWNFRCISVHSSLPISTYMLKISKWSAKNFVSHHFKWQTWPGRGQNSTAFYGGGARGKALSSLSCSCTSASFDASSSSGSGYSSGALTSIGRNVSLSYQKIRESTQVLIGQSLYHCPETSLWSSVSPITNERHASRHLCTLQAPEAPSEVYLCRRVFSLACSASVHSRSTRCAYHLSSRTSGFPFVSFDSAHLLIVQGFGSRIIWCAASCWASWSSVRMACIKLFTAEYSDLAPCFSITVSSSGSSGAPENSHIVWKHQS